jgi:hypothetical protein
MTLGSAARAGLRLVVWCRACGHQAEPDPAEHIDDMAPRQPFWIGASGWSVPAAVGKGGKRDEVAIV